MDWRSRLPLIGVALVAAACTPRPEPPTDSFDRQQLLADAVDQVAQPAIDDFVIAATALRDALDGGLADDNEPAVQDAFRAAATAWQRVELVQLGPAGTAGVATGGTAHRDEIYSWPLAVSPCLVDQQLVSKGYEQAGFFDDNGVDLYGMDALEVLVFHPSTNACPAGSPINADGTWDGLVADGFDAARAAYARRVAARVVDEATALAGEMEAFRDVAANAGEEGNAFSSAQAGVDELYAALFYLELRTKDLKLGVPLGLHVSCSASACPDKVESPWARQSMSHVATNLEQAMALYRGGEGLGLDDMLTELGAADLAERFDDELVAAHAAASGFEGTLADAVTSEPARARAVFDAVKVASDTLKADLVTVLNLRVPQEGAGDND